MHETESTVEVAPKPVSRLKSARARWLGGRLAVTCLLLGLASLILQTATRRHPLHYGLGLGQTWVEASSFNRELQIRWIELGDPALLEVLRGSRRSWRFVREILSFGEWFDSYKSRDGTAARRFLSATIDTRHYSLYFVRQDVRMQVVVDTGNASAWTPSSKSAARPWSWPGYGSHDLTVRVSQIGVPLPITSVGLLSIYGVAAAVRAIRFFRRPRDGTCRACGYNLTGNVSGVCPECGTGVTAP